MTMIGEGIPICYCNLNFDRSGIEEPRAQEVRGAAVDAFYNDRLEPSKVEPALVNQGFTVHEAHCATDGCLFQLMRRTCRTAEVITDPDNRANKTLSAK